jgi:hypothetical protein
VPASSGKRTSAFVAGLRVLRPPPILYIGNQPPVRSRPGLRRSRPTGRALGFYPRVKGFETSGRHASVAGATGQRGSLLRKWLRVRVPGDAHAPLEERDNSPGPHPGDCRFEPGTEHGPIVYRLGFGTFISGDRVRLPVGLLRGSQVRYGAGLITQRCAGSNPVPATKIHIPVSPNGRARGRYPRDRGSTPCAGAMASYHNWSVHRPVTAEGAGSSPAGVARPA